MSQTTIPRYVAWTVQAPGWLLLLYLIVAQGLTAFSYELGVAMGTQESPEAITEVGAAFWYGFAVGDIVIYIPLLLVGLVGHYRARPWGNALLGAALGITVYWPIVSIAALVDARDAHRWNVADETPYWIVCLLVVAYGLHALWILIRNSSHSRA